MQIAIGLGLARIVLWVFSLSLSCIPIMLISHIKRVGWFANLDEFVIADYKEFLIVVIIFIGLAMIDNAETLRLASRNEIFIWLPALGLLAVSVLLFLATMVHLTDYARSPSEQRANLVELYRIYYPLVLCFASKLLLTMRECTE